MGLHRVGGDGVEVGRVHVGADKVGNQGAVVDELHRHIHPSILAGSGATNYDVRPRNETVQ